MRLRSVTFVILVASVLAEPYGKGGGRGGGGRGGGGRGGGGGGRGYGTSSHSYPGSSGYSGQSSGGAHTYPASTGLSGSGNSGHTQQTNTHHGQQTHQQNQYHQTNTHYSKTEVHHHYHYSPPQQISYGSYHYPVYHSPPPVYVYEYRNSGSRFDTLLTGLALYNLGRMSASRSNYDANREYRSNPGEICKLGISKSNGEYEETRIDCRLMTSFIWESGSHEVNQPVVSTNKATTTVIETTSYSNGTRIDGSPSNTKVTTTVVENKTVVDALQVKGPSLSVTPDMKCFMIHISRDSSIKKNNIDCAVLQTYAHQSLYRNSNVRVLPTLVIVLTLLFSSIL